MSGRDLLDRRGGAQRRGGGALPPLLALYLDGTGDYAYVADADALTPAGATWSIDGWIYLPSLPTGTDRNVLVSKGTYPNQSLWWTIGDGTDPDGMLVWHPLAQPDAGSSFTRTPRFSGPPAGCWAYVAKAFDGGEALGGGAVPETRVRVWLGPNLLYSKFTIQSYGNAVLNDAFDLKFGASDIGGGVSAASYRFDWRMYSGVIDQAHVETRIAGGTPATALIRRWFYQRKGIFDDGAAYPPIAVADARYAAMPAALPRTIKVVHPIGDSITLGQEPDWAATGSPPGSSVWRGGWRRRVWDRALARGIQQRHRGGIVSYEGHPNEHGGWTGADMTSAALVTECQGSAALTPDARVFAMGTNDINTPFTLGQMQTNFAARMDDLFTGCTAPVGVPTVPLVPPQPGTLRVDYLAWLVATGIPAQVALGRDVQYIPIAFGAGDNAVGDTDTHLSDAGYEKAAVAIDAWLAANGC